MQRRSPVRPVNNLLVLSKQLSSSSSSSAVFPEGWRWAEHAISSVSVSLAAVLISKPVHLTMSSVHLLLCLFYYSFISFFCCVHGILSSLLNPHISQASMRRWSAFFSVHPSQPYVAMGQLRLFINRTLVSLVISRDFHIFDRDCIALLPMPSPFHSLQTPATSIPDIRSSKYVTCCNCWPCMVIVISILSFNNIMITSVFR